MQTLVFAAQKGGCGKTTLAVHLAVEYARQGRAVAVIDTDPQQSAALWGDLRDTQDLTVLPVPADQVTSALEAAKADGYDVAIVDTPPHASAALMLALRRADLAILPFRPSPLDLATLSTISAMVENAGIPAVVVINAAPVRAAENEPMRRAVEGEGLRVLATTVHDRMPFRRSLANGEAVTEFDPEGKAAREIRALKKEIDAITALRNEVTTQ